jgi:hypothetical protein
MRKPTLFLTVGLPCTGKTAAARRIEIEQKALRLTKDEWVKALYGHENPPSAQDVIESRPALEAQMAKGRNAAEAAGESPSSHGCHTAAEPRRHLSPPVWQTDIS